MVDWVGLGFFLFGCLWVGDRWNIFFKVVLAFSLGIFVSFIFIFNQRQKVFTKKSETKSGKWGQKSWNLDESTLVIIIIFFKLK